jgi:hypothetical protein
MSGMNLPCNIEELPSDELVRWVMEGLRRTLVHYGFWYQRVVASLGPEKAFEVEAEAGDQGLNIILKRLSSVLGFAMEDGVPKKLREMDREELLTLIGAISANWLVNDGVWFQAVESRYGMVEAKHCNDTCWSSFSPYEAMRIKKLLGMPDAPGLEGLKSALGFRMYTRINKQSIEPIDDNSFIFRMNECRVQWARNRKGLPDYPCKSAGLIEYPTFASTIDARIRTECVGCPPDAHPKEWYCAWKFSLAE